jgi:hypothetical protein
MSDLAENKIEESSSSSSSSEATSSTDIKARLPPREEVSFFI